MEILINACSLPTLSTAYFHFLNYIKTQFLCLCSSGNYWSILFQSCSHQLRPIEILFCNVYSNYFAEKDFRIDWSLSASNMSNEKAIEELEEPTHNQIENPKSNHRSQVFYSRNRII